MSSEDPLANASRGVALAVIDYSTEKIKQLARKFRDKSLYFIEDEDTLQVVKEQRKKGEWVLFREYVGDKTYHILFQIGLTIRAYERQGKDFPHLRTKVYNKYERKGLYITNFVQNGLFSKYIGNLLSKPIGVNQIKAEIKNLFDHIERTVIFIKTEDDNNIDHKVQEILAKIRAHSPQTFIISSIGAARIPCDIIKNSVMEALGTQYTSEVYEAQGELSVEEGKKIYFLNRKIEPI